MEPLLLVLDELPYLVFRNKNRLVTDAKFLSCVVPYLGNSSQVSDGAGAVLLMRRSVAMQKGLPILGVFRCVIQ